MFCPKAGPSLQAEKPRLQFCRRPVFHRKLRNQGCSFTRDLIGAVASRCFPNPTLSLASEQTLKDLKRSQGHRRGGEESRFGYLALRTSPKFATGVSSIRVLDQIRDLEIPINLRPHISYIIRAFCPRSGFHCKRRNLDCLQFCRRQIFHRKLRNQGCSFTRD